MKTLVIAPHPDDETLGVGGTLLKRLKQGHKIALLIITELKTNDHKKKEKEDQINKIIKLYKFSKTYRLNIESTKVDEVPMKKLTELIFNIVHKFKPQEIFIPHNTDAHSEHQKIYDAVSSSVKIFRSPFVLRVLSYETISETGYGLNFKKKFFYPNVYINISNEIKKKLEILKIYKSELSKHPFPRNLDQVKSLAKIRGAESNNNYAEAFELLRFIEK